MTKGERLEAAKLFYCSPSDNPPKLSPGWNKVVLLTAVRNSPCSCPFSVSLYPPQAALNSEPRKRWRLIVRFRSLHIKPALKGDSSRARPVGDAARGESGGIGSIASGSVARRPYSNQRCGFRVAKAGGVAARLLLFTSTPQSATPTASRKGEPYEERISLLAQAPFFDAEIHRRSCVGEKSQTFSLFVTM